MIKESIGFLLGAASRSSKRIFDQTLRKYDITAVQWAVLKYLEEEGAKQQTQIADELYMDKASVGTIIEKLMKKELIEREVSEEDRRAYQVRLTENAYGVVEEITPVAVQINEESCGDMSPGERLMLMELLQKIIDNLN